MDFTHFAEEAFHVLYRLGHIMSRAIIIRLVLTLLKAAMPGLRKKASETGTEIDNVLLDLAAALIALYESGELKIE